jgi:hypothetical protein
MRFPSILVACMMPALFVQAVLAAPNDVLVVESVQQATLDREGQSRALVVGDVLQERDLLQVDGRLSLRIARHGFIEIGSGSEVGIERLPFAPFAKDLKTIFSLSKGYARVVWKHPQLSVNWPLYVYMLGHRASLTTGEYFFNNQGQEQQVCVAAGQLALVPVGMDSVETLKPSACYPLVAGLMPNADPKNAEFWVSSRQQWALPASTTIIASAPPPAVASPALTSPVVVSPEAIDLSSPLPSATVPAMSVVEPSLPSVTPAYPSLAVPSQNLPIEPAPVVTASQTYRPATVIAVPASPTTTTTTTTIVKPLLPPVASVTPPLRNKPQPLPKPSALPVQPPLRVVLPLNPAAASRPEGAPQHTLQSAPQPEAGEWAINIASVPDQPSAQRERARVLAAGFPTAIIRTAVVNDKTYYRVQIPGFKSAGAAKAFGADVRAKLGIKDIWVMNGS